MLFGYSSEENGIHLQDFVSCKIVCYLKKAILIFLIILAPSIFIETICRYNIKRLDLNIDLRFQ